MVFRNKEQRSLHYGYPVIDWLTDSDAKIYFARHGLLPSLPSNILLKRGLRIIIYALANKHFKIITSELKTYNPYIYCYGYNIGPFYLGG